MQTRNPVDIWNFFKTNFPNLSKEVKQFKSYGGNSIILLFSDNGPFIFTIMPDKTWKLEPHKM